MRRIILPSVACPALLYSSTSHKRHDFRKEKVFERKICILIFPTIFLWNMFHGKSNACKVPVMRVRFWSNLNFLDTFSKKCSNTKFNENQFNGSRILPCGHSDGRTDITKLIVVLSNFFWLAAHWTFKLAIDLESRRLALAYFPFNKKCRILYLSHITYM